MSVDQLKQEHGGADHNRLLRTSEAANWLGLNANFLEQLRCRGEGPRYVRLRPGAVRYRLRDLKDYAAQCVVETK